MSQYYTFNDQAGVIPGIPGTFSNCRVDVLEDGSLEVQPLNPYQNWVASAVEVNALPVDSTAEVLPLEQGEPTEPLADAPVEAVAPPEEAPAPIEVVPEQQEAEAPQLALNIT